MLTAQSHNLPHMGRCRSQVVTHPEPGCVQPACLCTCAGPLSGPLLRPAVRAGTLQRAERLTTMWGTDSRFWSTFVLCRLCSLRSLRAERP